MTWDGFIYNLGWFAIGYIVGRVTITLLLKLLEMFSR